MPENSNNKLTVGFFLIPKIKYLPNFVTLWYTNFVGRNAGLNLPEALIYHYTSELQKVQVEALE